MTILEALIKIKDDDYTCGYTCKGIACPLYEDDGVDIAIKEDKCCRVNLRLQTIRAKDREKYEHDNAVRIVLKEMIIEEKLKAIKEILQ